MTKIENWIETSGLNPRSESDWNWEDVVSDFPTAVAFEPFNGLWAVYCECVDEKHGKSLLRVPPSNNNDDEYRSSNNWFPSNDEESYILVETKYVRPQ